MQDWAFTLQTKLVKAKNNTNTSSSPLFHFPEPLSPQLKAKFKNDLILKDGDEQHDAEPGQHAQILQEEVSELAALVVLAVPV